MNQGGWCIWITGLPGSGKSTIARLLAKMVKKRGVHAQIVSSDMLRKIITPKPTYSEQERDIVYGAIVFVALLLTKNKINVIIDATGNLRRYRDRARRQISSFMEAYLRCLLDVCIQRESERTGYAHAPKGIYKKAFQQKTATVPGLGAAYEEPINPEVTVDSDKLTPEQCAEKILEVLEKTLLL